MPFHNCNDNDRPCLFQNTKRPILFINVDSMFWYENVQNSRKLKLISSTTHPFYVGLGPRLRQQNLGRSAVETMFPPWYIMERALSWGVLHVDFCIAIAVGSDWSRRSFWRRDCLCRNISHWTNVSKQNMEILVYA